MSYHELSTEERVNIQLSYIQGFSLRRITDLIKRLPSTITRELRFSQEKSCGRYSAHTTQHAIGVRRRPCWTKRELLL